MFKKRNIDDVIEEKRKIRQQLLIKRNKQEELKRLDMEIIRLRKQDSIFYNLKNKIMEMIK